MKLKPVKIRNKTIEVPIIQGGMGIGVSLSNLAIAVMNEGGVGTISGAQPGYKNKEFFRSPGRSYAYNEEALRKEIKTIKENTPEGSFLMVNALSVGTDYEHLTRVVAEAGADAIVSGAGLPIELPEFTKGTDCANIPIVANSRVLNIIIRRWEKKYNVLPDAVVIEGPLAGGHLGIKYEEIESHEENATPLEERLKDVLEYMEKKGYDFPVFVAGGVYTHEDVKKFVELGADGVQLGTRFIATHECDAAESFKQKFVDAKKEDVVYVKSPVGYPARALRNALTDRMQEGNIMPTACVNCVLPCPGKHEDTPYCISEFLVKSVEGDAENGLVFTGANGWKIDKIMSVHELFQELLGEDE